MSQEKETRKKVPLGRITGAHGIKGWVKVFSHTEPREAILDYNPWLLGAEQREVELLEGARHGKSVLARLQGIGNREQAEALQGLEVAVERRRLPDPGSQQYYWADLIGLDVVLEDGESLGTIGGMMATGANDVMVVEGDRQRLIPFVEGQTVLGVDLVSGTVRVRWDKEF